MKIEHEPLFHSFFRSNRTLGKKRRKSEKENTSHNNRTLEKTQCKTEDNDQMENCALEMHT